MADWRAQKLSASQRELFIQKAQSRFRELPAQFNIGPHLISDYALELPKSRLTQAESFLKTLYKMTQSQHFHDKFLSKFSESVQKRYSPFSLFMCMDVHLTETGFQLIEINTNASLYAIGTFLFENSKEELNLSFETLKTDIIAELKSSPQSVQIVDENPVEEKLYIEFLIYQRLFESWGWPSAISDVSSIDSSASWIYNRHTDFYFEKSTALQDVFLNGQGHISPHPLSYHCLANKSRLQDFGNSEFLRSCNLTPAEAQTILQSIPQIVPLTAENSEELFKKRKNLFFKPAQSHGSKSAYRGSSISGKKFADLIDQNILAQTFVPAPKVQIEDRAMSFDVRLYFYQDQIRGALARVYEGQVTNSQTPNGGIAPIYWL